MTNRRHEPIFLDPFQKVLLPYLTGENDRTALRSLFLSHVDRGDVKVSLGGQSLADRDALISEIDKGIDQTLAHFAANALLLA